MSKVSCRMSHESDVQVQISHSDRGSADDSECKHLLVLILSTASKPVGALGETSP